jgi:hypothetical protein
MPNSGAIVRGVPDPEAEDRMTTLADAIADARRSLDTGEPDALESLDALVVAVERERGSGRLGQRDLMFAGQACELLGVASSNLRKLAGLPAPIAEGPPCGGRPTSVWLASDMREFAERRARERRGAGGE